MVKNLGIKKKVSRLSAVVALSVLFPFTNTFAAESSMLNKEAVIDLKALEQKSIAVQTASEDIKKKEQEISGDLSRQSEDIQKRVKDLEGKRGVLSVSALEEQRKAIEKDIMTLQSRAHMQQESVNRIKSDILIEIDEVVHNETEKVAKDKYTKVEPIQVYVYYDKRVFDDITEEVVKSMNNNVKHIDVNKFFEREGLGRGGVKPSVTAGHEVKKKGKKR